MDMTDKEKKNNSKSQDSITKEELISRYMERFADKTMSFWCVVELLKPRNHHDKFIVVASREDLQDTNPWWNWHHQDMIEYLNLLSVDQDDEREAIYFELSTWRYWDRYGERKQSIEEQIEIIWHPLTRWRLYQEISINQKEEVIDYLNYVRINMITFICLDKTIYERVESDVVRKILIELKEMIESE